MTDEAQHGHEGDDLWAWIDQVDPAPDVPEIDPDAVVAVMVVHDAAEWLPRQLLSLARLHPRPGRLIAVDTGSTDDSPQLLARARDEGVIHELLELGPEVAFGQAVGAALEGREAEWVWLLHDDSSRTVTRSPACSRAPATATWWCRSCSSRSAATIPRPSPRSARRSRRVGCGCRWSRPATSTSTRASRATSSVPPRPASSCAATSGVRWEASPPRSPGTVTASTWGGASTHTDTACSPGPTPRSTTSRRVAWGVAPGRGIRTWPTGSRRCASPARGARAARASQPPPSSGRSGSCSPSRPHMPRQSCGPCGSSGPRPGDGLARRAGSGGGPHPEDLLPNRYWPLRHAVDRIGAGLSERYRTLTEAPAGASIDELTSDDYAAPTLRSRVLAPSTLLVLVLLVTAAAAARTLLGGGRSPAAGCCPRPRRWRAPGRPTCTATPRGWASRPSPRSRASAAPAGSHSSRWCSRPCSPRSPGSPCCVASGGAAPACASAAAWAGGTVLLGLVTAGDVTGMVLSVAGPLLMRAIHAMAANQATGAERLRAPQGGLLGGRGRGGVARRAPTAEHLGHRVGRPEP
ncbi:hypothetical protein G7085_16675 [Tessaracoccus sp. HDW20]|uniref:hypothetical protein n=1 Tax=Tessaracoccus coleopterorum TaxID=2714950 RepID=UPI0018D2BC7F|nr:hypothetical protein [Tessaracoccus coleopterorum]NHB85681.1 hypothetical protein [Tessaracoccus coleopterorum]